LSISTITNQKNNLVSVIAVVKLRTQLCNSTSTIISNDLDTLNDSTNSNSGSTIEIYPRTTTPTVASFSTVPVVAGKVSVLVPATAGAAIVTCPDVSPAMTSDDMFDP
jgi:hypothetical protein